MFHKLFIEVGKLDFNFFTTSVFQGNLQLPRIPVTLVRCRIIIHSIIHIVELKGLMPNMQAIGSFSEIVGDGVNDCFHVGKNIVFIE